MDTRMALPRGTVLSFTNHEGGRVAYTIRREIGRGGSSIVYDASYYTNLGDEKIVYVKECYPFGLRISRRCDQSLNVHEGDVQSFERVRMRLREGFLRNNLLFDSARMANLVSNTIDLYSGNGTDYIVSTYLNGETLNNYRCESLKNCISLLIGTAEAILRLHDSGFLYLDLKPENIFVAEGNKGLVLLFDFDSMISIAELDSGRISDGRISYSAGFAAPEQKTEHRWKLSVRTDIYAIGAILFYMLFGRTPDAFDCDDRGEFDFTEMVFRGEYPDDLYTDLTVFFHKTIIDHAPARYRDMTMVLEQLRRIERDADETEVFLRSAVVRAPGFCYGRETEIARLRNLLSRDNAIVTVYGPGGIGKTTLVKEYIARNHSDFDTILMTHWNGSMVRLITDDRSICLNAVERAPEETIEDYYVRKLGKLARVLEDHRTLIVIDDMNVDDIGQMEAITRLAWTILIISRRPIPGTPFDGIRVDILQQEPLRELFESNLRSEIPKADTSGANRILELVAGHTLMVELIARQIHAGFFTLNEAVELMEKYGFSHMGEESVDYLRDGELFRGTVAQTLERLFLADGFPEETVSRMHILSLFGLRGINVSLYRKLTDTVNMDILRPVMDSGWLRMENRELSMHPVIREYIANRPVTVRDIQQTDAMMERLYCMIRRIGGKNHPDADRTYTKDYQQLYELLNIAQEVLRNESRVSTARMRLLYCLAMDLPVDRETEMLTYANEIIQHADSIETESALRIYAEAAYVYARINNLDSAWHTLDAMKTFLNDHPSKYYLAVYYHACAVILYNTEPGTEIQRLNYLDAAIKLANESNHPDSKKQLASSMTCKATEILTSGAPNEKVCRELLRKAGELLDKYCGEYDYERYECKCITAVYYAICHNDRESALAYMKEADRIADVARDSDLSYLEHMCEQNAPLYRELGMLDEAVTELKNAIERAQKHDSAPYHRLIDSAQNALTDLYEIMESLDDTEIPCKQQ